MGGEVMRVIKAEARHAITVRRQAAIGENRIRRNRGMPCGVIPTGGMNCFRCGAQAGAGWTIASNGARGNYRVNRGNAANGHRRSRSREMCPGHGGYGHSGMLLCLPDHGKRTAHNENENYMPHRSYPGGGTLLRYILLDAPAGFNVSSNPRPSSILALLRPPGLFPAPRDML